MPPEGGGSRRRPPEGGARTENPHKNDRPKQVPLWGACWRLGRPKREYSGELCSQKDSKMEPKMVPKVMQKGSLLKNMKKSIRTTIYYT